eukprot:GHVN01091688.1.p1 GENE.GHVN01091688.1~~GHVN01091688.1.p1  ORF type:complete len:254 (+),score=71.59 GHVN01091688.1:682-1443(+)
MKASVVELLDDTHNTRPHFNQQTGEWVHSPQSPHSPGSPTDETLRSQTAPVRPSRSKIGMVDDGKQIDGGAIGRESVGSDSTVNLTEMSPDRTNRSFSSADRSKLPVGVKRDAGTHHAQSRVPRYFGEDIDTIDEDLEAVDQFRASLSPKSEKTSKSVKSDSSEREISRFVSVPVPPSEFRNEAALAPTMERIDEPHKSINRSVSGARIVSTNKERRERPPLPVVKTNNYLAKLRMINLAHNKGPPASTNYLT